MRTLFFCFFLCSGCAEPVNEPSDSNSSFFGGGSDNEKPKSALSKTIRTSGGDSLKLEDGSELILPSGTFSSPVDVTFSRSRCDGIFASSSFSSCQYSVDFSTAPTQRFDVKIPGNGVLTGLGEEGYKPVGVLHKKSALTTQVFALRTGDDDSCLDVEFSACGGELAGQWELKNACGPRKEILPFYSTFNPDPYAVCGEGEWLREYPFTTTKKLTFSVNGQYEENGSFDIKERKILTQACLDTVGETCHEICSFDNGICTCLRNEGGGGSASGGSWAYAESPTTFVLNGPNPEEGEESGPGEERDYCVDGDILTVRAKGRSAVFVYRRK